MMDKHHDERLIISQNDKLIISDQARKIDQLNVEIASLTESLDEQKNAVSVRDKFQVECDKSKVCLIILSSIILFIHE